MPAVIADTHALIWYLADSPRLSASASSYLRQCTADSATIGISSISVVEIVYLVEKGRIPPEALSRLSENLAQEPEVLEVVPVTYSIARAVQQVPRAQVPDLPDRIIAATALHLAVPLVSRDARIRASDVQTVW